MALNKYYRNNIKKLKILDITRRTFKVTKGLENHLDKRYQNK